MIKPTKRDLKKITLDYDKALVVYKQMVEKEEITPTTEILAAYDKVNETHKKYMEVSRLYVINKLQPQD